MKTEFYDKFKQKFVKLIKNNKFSDIIFLCIGTSKIVGDAIGPIVGSKLKKLENEYIHIYGTIESNLNFNNTKKIIKSINSNYRNPCIITIDAALSCNNNIGDIIVGSGIIKIGKALKKNLCFYSDLNIKCIVGMYFYNENENFRILQNSKIEQIMKLGISISNDIKDVLENCIIKI